MIRVARHFLARRSRATCRRRAAWALALALLLFPCAAHAAALDQYTVQVLAQSGVQTPGFNPIGNYFAIYQMNDHGQISLVTRTQESNSHQVLGVLSNGQFTPIAAGGGPSPDGKTWPTNMSFAWNADINESGNVAFVPVDGAGNSLGVYFWDVTKHAVNRLATPETPATGDLAFASGGKNGGAALNNRDEVAFVAPVKAASGSAGKGVFLRRADGHIEPVVLPDDALPGQGEKLRNAAPSQGARTGRDHSLSPVCALIPTNCRRRLRTQRAHLAMTVPPQHPPARTVMPPTAHSPRAPVGVLSESIHRVRVAGSICRPSQGATPRCGGRTRRTVSPPS